VNGILVSTAAQRDGYYQKQNLVKLIQTCCIHQRNDADRTYLWYCPARAWTRLRCL